MAIKNFQKHNAKMDLFSSFRQALNISWQRIMSFSEACQNSPGFTLTHQTHLQECWLVHMWHVRKQRLAGTSQCGNAVHAVHLRYKSMVLTSRVCTTYDYRIAGVSRTIAKQISTCPWPLGCRGHFTFCIVL